MAICDRHWEPLTFDFNEFFGFSPVQYFQWEPSPSRSGWQRKRPFRELLDLFDRLINIDGTATQESVLHDPEVIEQMASADKAVADGPSRIWRHTTEIALFQTMIEAKLGKKIFKRPVIPGQTLREKRKVVKLKSKLGSVGVKGVS